MRPFGEATVPAAAAAADGAVSGAPLVVTSVLEAEGNVEYQGGPLVTFPSVGPRPSDIPSVLRAGAEVAHNRLAADVLRSLATIVASIGDRILPWVRVRIPSEAF